MQERIQSLRYFGEFHSWTAEYLVQVLVAVDEFPLVTILELVRLYVLPERRYNDGPRLRMHAQ